MSTAGTAVCTICAKNYTARARTLMASLARHEPDWDRHVLFVDEIEGFVDPAQEAFRVHTDAEVGIPDRRRFLFRYELVEANTAAKPWFLAHLLDAGYERVIYLDPDMLLLTPLPELEEGPAAEASIVLTPHITRPQPAGAYPDEIAFLQYGTYNLGFLALRQGASSAAFLAWWQGHLERDGVIDPPGGLFVDQKWVDLVPSMHADVHVLRHEGYNVAHWNLATRTIAENDGRLLANDDPLRLFHFSAFDPDEPMYVTRIGLQRDPLHAEGALRPLLDAYASSLMENGDATTRTWAYAYGCTADGLPLPRCIRRLARRAEDGTALPEDPFQVDAAWLNSGVAPEPHERVPYTRVMDALWRELPELRWLHPDAAGEQRLAYARWFVAHAGEKGVDEAFVRPVRDALERRPRRSRGLFSRR